MKITANFLIIGLLTIIVAACSIIYELVYSQALTVLYGGTVARYSITIGLYLISLGTGAFFFNSFKFKNNVVFFWWIELLLSVVGPFGVLAIFQLSATSLSLGFAPHGFIFLISHLPILIVGVLSGIEIPLLVSLLNPEEKDKFSRILGLDYLGAFLGTVAYSLLLFPHLGLLATALWTGFFNFLSMSIYTIWKMGKKPLLKIVSVLLFTLYFILLFFSQDIQNYFQKMYCEDEIRFQFKEDPEVRSVQVKESFSTPYQFISVYQTTSPKGEVDNCLSLDSHTQVCDSTYQSYHSGLVDVPMLFVHGEKLKVLVIGGGDFIVVDYLLQYPQIESIDQVDIDGKFLEFMKTHPHFKTLHHDAYKNPKLNTLVEDGFTYLRFNRKQYDLILIDLPGIQHDKLAHLYSAEFFQFLYRSLSDRGVVSGWMYGALQDARKHYRVLMNTLREGGFKNHILYDAYQPGEMGDRPSQPFYILSKKGEAGALMSIDTSDYLNRLYPLYQDLTWIEIPFFPGIRPNTVLKPNYDIILKR